MVVVRLRQPAVLAEVVEPDHLVPGLEELRDEIAVDEPGGAGDEDLHESSGRRAMSSVCRPSTHHAGGNARYPRTSQPCCGNRLFVVYGQEPRDQPLGLEARRLGRLLEALLGQRRLVIEEIPVRAARSRMFGWRTMTRPPGFRICVTTFSWATTSSAEARCSR